MSNQAPIDYFKSALNWETSRIFQVERSERRAWTVALIALVVTVLSWVALALLVPLKEKVPYVIRVDQRTGAHDILTHLNAKEVTYGDVLDKYWLSIYVRARESYDFYTLQKEYDTVGLLSSQKVAVEYSGLFKGEQALDKKQGNRVRTRVEILSLVPDGKGRAVVRFVKKTQSLAEGAASMTQWVATLAYRYENPSKMKERDRLTNPFGFQVYSYRIDPEGRVDE